MTHGIHGIHGIHGRSARSAFFLGLVLGALCLVAGPGGQAGLLPRRHVSHVSLLTAMTLGDKAAAAELQEVLITAGQALAQTTLEDYRAMVDDEQRTAAYAAAIQRRAKGATVADVGTGPFALLAMLAVKFGARKVYAIERTPEVAAEARKCVKDAGLEEVISVIEGDSKEVNLPEKVDLIVSELVGNVATGEGVVDTIRDARRRFLREDLLKDPEAMIPRRCQTAIAPVMYVNHELLAAKGPEFVERPFKLFSETKDLQFLAAPQLLEDFDLCSPGGPGVDDLLEKENLDFEISQSVEEKPLFSGFALWPRLVVDQLNHGVNHGVHVDQVVDIQNVASHWSYVVALMSKQRIPLSNGCRIVLQCQVDLGKVPYSYLLRGKLLEKDGKSRFTYIHLDFG